MLDYVSMRSDSTSATVELAGRTVHVSEVEIAWGNDQTLTLPDDWQGIEFKQSGREIEVLVDGAFFTTILANGTAKGPVSP
jgi:hypothetical protein